MKKWMDKGAAKAEGGTPAPRGVPVSTKFLWRDLAAKPEVGVA